MTSAYELVTQRLTEVTGYAPRGRGDWRCPAHDDSTASLSVNQGDRGVVLHCHANCDTNDVLAALNLSATDLFDQAATRDETKTAQPIATYPYVDEHGTLLFQVVRYPDKQFRQRRPDGNGGWIYKIGNTRRPLYRLPTVIEAVKNGCTVWVVEGEKDVEALERAGQVATCNPGGAGKWRPEHAQTLHGAAEVIIVRDKDPAGIKHTADVEASLLGQVGQLYIVEAATGKDAADHLGAGHTIDDFGTVGQWPAPTTETEPTFFVDWPTFWAKDRRNAEWLYEDVLARGRGHSIYAGHKIGKSLFLLSIATQLITDIDPTVVIYLDYEMGEDDLYERLADMGHGAHSNLSRLRYALLPSLPPLDSPDGAKALLAKVDGVQAEWPDHHLALIIDTTGRAVAGEENSADTVRAFYRWTGLGLKQRGLTWARLDHAGKDATKGQRGSSAKGDDVDIVWRLNRADDGITLHRQATRMGWVPERVAFRQIDTPTLRFVRVTENWPAGTKELAEDLDRLDVPLDAGERPAREILREANVTASQHLLRAAIRWRREEAKAPTR